MSEKVTLQQILKATGGKYTGEQFEFITNVNTLDDATNTEITFLDNIKYREKLASTKAAIVILKPQFAKECPVATLESDNPYLAYARVCALFGTDIKPKKGIHHTVSIGENCKIPVDVSIAANVTIGNNVNLANGVVIGPGCYIEDNCVLGINTELKANVTVLHDVQIGNECIIHSGCVIGSDGFGNANDNGKWVKIKHLGTVIIGNDVEVGSNTTIDRGALKNTIIEDNVRIDNLVQIAHNVHIGAHTAIAGCVGIAGSASIGKYCMIGGAAGINGHIKICDKVVVMGMAMVTNSITKPGFYGSGTGLMPRKEWLRAATRLRQLDELFARVKTLEYMSGKGIGKVTKKFFGIFAKISSRISQLLHLRKHIGK